MKCCCFGFEGSSQMAGSRGFGLFTVAAESGEPQFVLQHRALDPAVTSPSTAHPVSIVSDTVIQFCPWCGVRLKEWYGNAWKKLERPDLRVRI